MTKPHPEWVWYTFTLSVLHFYSTVFCKTVFLLQHPCFLAASLRSNFSITSGTLVMLFSIFWILRMLCSPEALKIWHSRSPTFTSCDVQDGQSLWRGTRHIFVKYDCPIFSVYVCPVNICTYYGKAKFKQSFYCVIWGLCFICGMSSTRYVTVALTTLWLKSINYLWVVFITQVLGRVWAHIRWLMISRKSIVVYYRGCTFKLTNTNSEHNETVMSRC